MNQTLDFPDSPNNTTLRHGECFFGHSRNKRNEREREGEREREKESERKRVRERKYVRRN